MSDGSIISLLYPKAYLEKNTQHAALDMSCIADLSADAIIQLLRYNTRYFQNHKNPIVYFTNDVEVIRYRLDVVEDILNNESLFTLLAKLLPDLENMRELYLAGKEQNNDTTSSLYSISELQLYTDCMERLHTHFQKEAMKFSSLGMKAFASEVASVYGSEGYQALKVEAEKISYSVRNIKSITIGVNLDAQLIPVEAGLVSVNKSYYKSGNIIDKLLRADLKQDEFTCLAPLEASRKGVSGEQHAKFGNAVKSTLNSVLMGSVKNWKPAVRSYTNAKSAFLFRLIDEIRFLLGGVSLLRKLKASGAPICKPHADYAENKSFSCKGLYNPSLVLRQDPQANDDSLSPFIVPNDIDFDDNSMVYILTGPNQGGKTVFTQAVGIAQLLFQLGLFVPAYSATISPVDSMYTHFQNQDNRSYSNGRFGEECERLMNIMSKLTQHSLLLMDETFSSTSAAEATYIAEQVLIGLRAAGCRVIFATHLHDLARNINEMNNNTSYTSRIDSLTAKLVENSSTPGKRSFKIVRARPEGNSYARDIAEKYGLTLENLLVTLDEKKYSEI
jgi:DNA mismatch repair protein MutS